uniref:DNA methyltransferase n=1 Tax=Segatella hominis TaxID=2518605 RepID=UPI004028FDC2
MNINIKQILPLYNDPFPSTRTGALFNAFSYPTKISPESEALFIACHTNIGDSVLDPFGGSGTTAIAAKLCDSPTEKMLEMSEKYGLNPQWGPRKAFVYEISTIGYLLGNTLCHTNHSIFEKYAKELLSKVEDIANKYYRSIDNNGHEGVIRYIIWSDVLACPHCKEEIRYSDFAIDYNPLSFKESGVCPSCGKKIEVSEMEKVKIEKFDPILNRMISVKKRVPFKIYGETNGKKWQRLANDSDIEYYQQIEKTFDYSKIPNYEIKWGELYRQGYHYGISHIHHFYTSRNVVLFSLLWNEIGNTPEEIQDAMKVFLLSYNLSHSTLMTRVVAKKNNKDFVITGSQPGVLYVSSLPVEKNIYFGLKRKLKTFISALGLLDNSKSDATFYNSSSTSMDNIENSSIDYVFTDPPFGDFIPYSEINQINECWLGSVTNNSEEVIINNCQGKTIDSYSDLMNSVFSEIQRVLKENANCTLVFHSAKAEIWRTIIKAYKTSGLSVELVSILDKVQKTFKQTNSNVTVKGDPIILLKNTPFLSSKKKYKSDIEIAEHLLELSKDIPFDKEKAARLYSIYIITCIENGIQVSLNANYFFEHDQNK